MFIIIPSELIITEREEREHNTDRQTDRYNIPCIQNEVLKTKNKRGTDCRNLIKKDIL